MYHCVASLQFMGYVVVFAHRTMAPATAGVDADVPKIHMVHILNTRPLGPTIWALKVHLMLAHLMKMIPIHCGYNSMPEQHQP